MSSLYVCHLNPSTKSPLTHHRCVRATYIYHIAHPSQSQRVACRNVIISFDSSLLFMERTMFCIEMRQSFDRPWPTPLMCTCRSTIKQHFLTDTVTRANSSKRQNLKKNDNSPSRLEYSAQTNCFNAKKMHENSISNSLALIQIMTH